MARETSIIIPVVPQLDDRATQGFWKDIKKLQKDLKKVDVGFKNTSKTAAQNVQQLRQMSKSAESFGKTLSSGAASVYKNLGKLSDKLEKEQEKAAKAIRGKTKAKAAGKDTKESNIDSLCYAAVLGADSAKMVLKNEKGLINGTLYLNFSEKDDLNGTIAGTFKGDTLFLDYTYHDGKRTEYFKNPFAFLKKDGKYYQGYGEVTTTYGRAHFKEGVPLDFTKGFTFSAVDCK